jgi:hypothetical protein
MTGQSKSQWSNFCWDIITGKLIVAFLFSEGFNPVLFTEEVNIDHMNKYVTT